MNKKYIIAVLNVLITPYTVHASAPKAESSSSSSSTEKPFTLVALPAILHTLNVGEKGEEVEVNGENLQKKLDQKVNTVIDDRYKMACEIHKLNPSAPFDKKCEALSIEIKARVEQCCQEHVKENDPITFAMMQADSGRRAFTLNLMSGHQTKKVFKIVEKDCQTYKNGPIDDGKCITQ